MCGPGGGGCGPGTMSERSVLEAVVELDAWLDTDMLCWLLWDLGVLGRSSSLSNTSAIVGYGSGSG